MENSLFFSVVIPTYNRADFIRRTVQSVLDQQYDHYEIIIVDDGSSDNTDEVVKSIPSGKITYYKIENSERAVARNFGIDRAKGDYITFLDSDDILYKDYLQNASSSLKKYDYPVFFHLAYESKSEATGKPIAKFSVKNDDIYSLVNGNHLSCLGIFLKREGIKGFRFNEDRSLSGSEDWELWLRLAAHFGLKTDQRISSALMVHDSRSVYSYDENELLQRKNLALMYSFRDEAVKKVYGKYRRAMEAYCDSYISLHLALARQNSKSLRYLISAIAFSPEVIFRKRTLAIVKYLFLNVFRLRGSQDQKSDSRK